MTLPLYVLQEHEVAAKLKYTTNDKKAIPGRAFVNRPGRKKLLPPGNGLFNLTAIANNPLN
jgi:hypothetical protein